MNEKRPRCLPAIASMQLDAIENRSQLAGRRSGTWWWPRPAVGIGASEQTSVQIPNVGEKILTGAWNP